MTYWVDDIFPQEIEECDPEYIGNNNFDEEDGKLLSDDDDSDYDTYWGILIFEIEFLIL